MTGEHFSYKSLIPASASRVFEWHKRNGAFARLTPPWLEVDLVESTGGIENGARVAVVIHNGSISVKWTLEHKDYQEGKQFCDYQVDGPFVSWEHVHRVEPASDSSCYLIDSVEYELPAFALGQIVSGSLVRTELNKLFQYRHQAITEDIKLANNTAVQPMRILISGSTGLVGSQLVAFLTSQGHSIARLVRPESKVQASDTNQKVVWNPYQRSLDLSQLEGFDAVVHLSGDNLGSERWNEVKKKKLLASRLKTTQVLCQALNSLSKLPRVFLSASAIGIYGDRGDEPLSEQSERGVGFLADICDQWEEAARAVDHDVRLVNMRMGVVLSPKGGALKKMLLPFQMGGGGPIGSGHQFFSWIDIDDLVGAIYHAMAHGNLSGPVNMVSPNVVTNGEFASTLGHVLSRPAIIPLPAFAARALFGDMADECLLASQNVQPTKLLQSGYQFRNPDLESSLRKLLGKPI